MDQQQQPEQVALFDLADQPSIAEHINELYGCAGDAATLMAQCDPDGGSVEAGLSTIPVKIAAKQQELSPIRYRFGSWAVTTYGVECLIAYYPIPRSRLFEPQDWEQNLAAQPWISVWDLVRALIVARHLYPQDNSFSQSPQ
jgi:hypothetical protein